MPGHDEPGTPAVKCMYLMKKPWLVQAWAPWVLDFLELWVASTPQHILYRHHCRPIFVSDLQTVPRDPKDLQWNHFHPPQFLLVDLTHVVVALRAW